MAERLPVSATNDTHPGSVAAAPRMRSTLVGRELELTQIERMLIGDELSLLTLTGPGGVGKTRLAIEVSHRLAPSFPDGVVYVPLDAIAHADLLSQAICDRLQLGNAGASHLWAVLIDHLRSRRTLLVLDCFEHLLDAGADVVRLLEECQQLKVLVTSRTRLRVSLEHDLPVPPLSMPAAVELFVARARASDPGFALDVRNAGDVAAICARLDGLPLALELAAARIHMFSPQALRGHLEPPLDLLTTGARDLPDRHRTMRDAIAWSYDLLAPAEQVLFRRLAVFEHGFRLDVAERVVPEVDLLDGVLSLINASLLFKAEIARDTEPRFQMLDVVREYGIERLVESGEDATIRRRHAEAMRELAREISERVWTSESQQALSRFERERANFRAALRWAAAAGDFALELELAGRMVNYWRVRGHYLEGRRVLQEAISHSGSQATPELARAYVGLCWFASLLGDFDPAHAAGVRALELSRQYEQRMYAAQALHVLAMNQRDQGNFTEALDLANQALAIYRQVEDDEVAGPQYLSSVLSTVGGIALGAGDITRASRALEEELSRQRSWSFTWRLGETLRYLGHVALARADADTALALYRESIVLAREYEDRLFIVGSVVAMAMAEAEQNHAERAVRLLGAADTISRQVGFAIDRWEHARYEAVLVRLRHALPNGAFQDVWNAGALLSFEETLSEALDISSGSPSQPMVIHGDDSLTARERDVLALLIEGRSDREIGEALHISPRTASGHVAHLLAKLDVPSRTAAATYAMRRQLVDPPVELPTA